MLHMKHSCKLQAVDDLVIRRQWPQEIHGTSIPAGLANLDGPRLAPESPASVAWLFTNRACQESCCFPGDDTKPRKQRANIAK